MTVHLQRQVDKLKRMVLDLGDLVLRALDRAVDAVRRGDAQLAVAVIRDDDRIDRQETEVEEECLHTLALHQPVAFDLRYVVATLKANNDLERIGDRAVSISERARAHIARVCELVEGLPLGIELAAAGTGAQPALGLEALRRNRDLLAILDIGPGCPEKIIEALAGRGKTIFDNSEVMTEGLANGDFLSPSGHEFL